MTSDGLEGVTIEYNSLNLPRKVSSSGTVKANYCYLADGTKVSALTAGGTGLVYRGPFTYRRSSAGALTLESAACEEGRLTPSGAMLHVTDHIGSVVAVVRGSDGALYEASDYDAYGKRSSLTNAGTVSLPSGVTQRDRFTGKQDQGPDFAVGYTDFGARHYSPSLRRWLVPDPLSEKYYGISPYAYCAGDPVNRVDPDGRNPIIGALAGAGIDIGMQIATNLITGEKWYEIDGKSVAISAGAGAVGVGLSSKIKQFGNLAKISKAAVMATEVAAETVVSGTESVAKQYASDGTVSFKQVTFDATAGAISSSVGQVAKHIKQIQGDSEYRVLKRQLDHAERVAGNNPRPSRQEKVNTARSKVEDYGNNDRDKANTLTLFLIEVSKSIYEENNSTQ